MFSGGPFWILLQLLQASQIQIDFTFFSYVFPSFLLPFASRGAHVWPSYVLFSSSLADTGSECSTLLRTRSRVRRLQSSSARLVFSEIGPISCYYLFGPNPRSGQVLATTLLHLGHVQRPRPGCGGWEKEKKSQLAKSIRTSVNPCISGSDWVCR